MLFFEVMTFSRSEREFGWSLGVLKAQEQTQCWKLVNNFKPPPILYTSLKVKKAYIDAFIGTIRGYWEGGNDCCESKTPKYRMKKYILNPKNVKEFYINGYIENYYIKKNY